MEVVAALYRSCWFWGTLAWENLAESLPEWTATRSTQIYAVMSDGSLEFRGNGNYQVTNHGPWAGYNLYGYDGSQPLTPTGVDIEVGTGGPKCFIGVRDGTTRYLVFATYPAGTNFNDGYVSAFYSDALSSWKVEHVIYGPSGSTTIEYPVTSAVPIQDPPSGYTCAPVSGFPSPPTIFIRPLLATGGGGGTPEPPPPGAFWTDIVGAFETR